MLKSCAVAFVALVAATGVSAKSDDDKKGDDKEKIICRSEPVTGSRVKKRRTCMTAEQWAELSSQTQKSINDFSRASGAPPGVKNPLAGQ